MLISKPRIKRFDWGNCFQIARALSKVRSLPRVFHTSPYASSVSVENINQKTLIKPQLEIMTSLPSSKNDSTIHAAAIIIESTQPQLQDALQGLKVESSRLHLHRDIVLSELKGARATSSFSHLRFVIGMTKRINLEVHIVPQHKTSK